jgi:molecular chaperone DnaK
MELARHDYETLIEPLLNKTLVCVDESLSDAKLQANQIDKVILVGGASRTPMVHQMLNEQLQQPLHSEIDPDLCVAMGAAVQGGLIAGIDLGPVLVDITPHTLGIQTFGELLGFASVNHFSPIIERNTPLPATRSQLYHTMVDGQEQAIISVFQGEDQDVRHNDPVGEFMLEGLSDAARGNEILVRFDLDLDGILKVTARERATALEKQLTIDNAVSRFRRRNHEDAKARLETAFQQASGAASAGESGPATATETVPDDLPGELREAILKGQQLIAKGRQLAPNANPEDAEEIRELVQKLDTAITNRSQSEIEETIARLDDLVFYLQDA